MLRKLNYVGRITGVILFSLLASCGDSYEAFTDPMTIIALGDSLTAGYQIPVESAFPAQLERDLHTVGYTGVTVVNAGVSGDTSRDGLARLPKLIARQAEVVIIELGINDLLMKQKKPEQIHANLEQIIQQFRAQGAMVVLTGVEVPGVMQLRAGLDKEGFRDMFESLALQYNLPLYPSFLDDVTGKEGMTQQDRVHPTEQGSAVIAANLMPLVRKALHAAKNKKEGAPY